MSDSIYKTLGVDTYDLNRDARTWPGGNPVVAHPPCRAWGRLRHLAKPEPGEKQLAIDAVNKVRQWGGVIEHPVGSKLWKEMQLPLDGSCDKYGGFTLKVNQSWWGHRAEKATLLYICGCLRKNVPLIPINFDAIQYTIASSIKKKSGKRTMMEVTKKEREATPINFAKWLIEVAACCNKNSQLNKNI